MPAPVSAASRRLLAALAFFAFVLLTACAGSTNETVATAVKDSSSAVATARLALRQDMDGKLTRAATSTALEDGLKEVQTSRGTVLKLAADTQGDRDTQKQALDALDRCAAAFATARAALSTADGGTPSPADGDAALAAAQDALDQLGQKVGSK
ncbi:hypothetical protein [Arthrobacter sp. MAHUQ-56]